MFIFNRNANNIQALSLKESAYPINDLVNLLNEEDRYSDVQFKRDSVFALVDSKISALNSKIDANHPLLKDLFFVGKGMETAANDVFLFAEYPKQFPKQYIKKRLAGENISPYFFDDNTDYLLYFEDVEDFKELPASIQEYLKKNRKVLCDRATVKNEGRVWWRYSRPMHREMYYLPKIWCSYRSAKNEFVLDETSDYIGLTNTTVIFGTNSSLTLKYLLGILNSKLFAFRYQSIAKQTGGGVFEYVPNAVGRFPIPALDLSNPKDKDRHDTLAALVEEMLALKKREAAEVLPQARTVIQRQIAALDRRIDAAVYGLYGLTDEEIKVVEGS